LSQYDFLTFCLEKPMFLTEACAKLSKHLVDLLYQRFVIQGRYFNDGRGNVAIVFSLSVMGLVLICGGGVDFSRQLEMRAHIQDAADAAVLRATTMTEVDLTKLKVASNQAFDKNLGLSNAVSIMSKDLAREVLGKETNFTYTAQAEIDSIFLGIIGIPKLSTTVVSKSQSEIRKSEVVFVLDSTGSMSNGGRMTNLKSSVDTVLASLLNGSGVNSSGTKVGIVPFDTQVKIPKGENFNYIDYGKAKATQSCSNLNSNYCNLMIEAVDKVCAGANNINACRSSSKLYTKTYVSGSKTYYEVYVRAKEDNGGEQTVYNYTLSQFAETVNYPAGQNCNGETGVCTPYAAGSTTKTTFNGQLGSKSNETNSSVYDSVPSGFTAANGAKINFSVNYNSGYDSAAAYSETVTTNGVPRTIYWPAVDGNKSAWAGCIIDRQQPFDVSSSSPSNANINSLYPARPCNNNNLAEIKALSDNIASARSHVQTLKPSGNTNITIGIQWGMEVLSPPDPFTGGVPFRDASTQKFMILVTDGQNTRNRFTSNTAQIDARTALACEAAKAENITVFVVRVVEGNSELLRKCATRPEYFYDLTSATQLNEALKEVFKAMKKARLTK
jgi:Flp pilus assembly protein TadG